MMRAVAIASTLAAARAGHQLYLDKGHELRAAVAATYQRSYADQLEMGWQEWWECALWAWRAPERHVELLMAAASEIVVALMSGRNTPAPHHPPHEPMTVAQLRDAFRDGTGRVVVTDDV